MYIVYEKHSFDPHIKIKPLTLTCFDRLYVFIHLNTNTLTKKKTEKKNETIQQT